MSSPRALSPRLLFLLLVLLCAPRLLAQEQRWRELGSQAKELREQGRYDEGVAVAQEALRVAEAAFGPEDPRVATSLNDLALLYWVAGKFSQVEPLYQRALQIREKALGPNHLEVASSLNNLGMLYWAGGKRAEAESLLQRALAIKQKLLAPDDPDLADALSNLAALYVGEGKYVQAEPPLQLALQIREKAPEDRELATSLSYLGMLYWAEGKYAEAEPLLQRALAIAEKTLVQDDPGLALALANLGAVYRDEGKYALAEPLLLNSLRILEKVLKPEDPDLAAVLSHLASLYLEEAKYDQAEPLYQRALRIREKALGPEHPEVAETIGHVAALYEMQGRHVEAVPLRRRALEIDLKAFGPEDPRVAADLNNLAGLYGAAGLNTQAESFYQRAIAIWEKTQENLHLASALDSLAVTYIKQGKYLEAEPLLERALSIQEKLLAPEHPDVALSLNHLAMLRFVEGLPAEAEPLFARVFDIFFRRFQYQFSYMSEKETLGLLATVDYRFPIYFSFVHRFRAKQPELTGRMYDLLLWQKGFVVARVAGQRHQIEVAGDPAALQLLDQLATRRSQLAALANVETLDRESRRRQLEAEANDLEKALVARSATFAQQKKLERVAWQQVRDALKPGEAAVEFARFRFYDGKQWTDKTYYVALVVTPETRDQPAYIVLGEGKDLEGAPLLQFQQGVQARGTATTEEAVIAPGAPAYDLFWKPLEPLLAGKTRVYLSPDGVLNQMPLGLIPAPDGKLLMEKYDLRLVSSTKDLLRAAPAPATNSAVLVGDPSFTLADAQYRAALARSGKTPGAEPTRMARLGPTELSRDQGASATLPPLPGTGAEVQAVTSLLQQHQWQASLYTADRALEEAVKQARSPRLLHLATHGFFLPDQQVRSERMGFGGDQPSGLEDPMLRSGLYFAGADRARAGQPTPQDLDDGVLTAYEATSLNLQGTELVVLSACNTGQGDVHNGEGVFGLRRALQEAGAQAVMMSLWSVPDKETQELMTLFYGKWLSGVEKHEALRQAQLELREKVRQRYGRDLPYYWGAFVLVGR